MTESAWRDMVLLLFGWIGYFALHSILASLAVKRRVAATRPNLMPYYRLVFNILAVLLLLPILWLSHQCLAVNHAISCRPSSAVA